MNKIKEFLSKHETKTTLLVLWFFGIVVLHIGLHTGKQITIMGITILSAAFALTVGIGLINVTKFIFKI